MFALGDARVGCGHILRAVAQRRACAANCVGLAVWVVIVTSTVACARSRGAVQVGMRPCDVESPIEACSCTPRVPVESGPLEPGLACCSPAGGAPDWRSVASDSTTGSAGRQVDLHLSPDVSCVVGVRSGICGKADAGDVLLTLSNRGSAEVLVPRFALPILEVVGAPGSSADRRQCWSEWGRSFGANIYPQAVRLDDAIVIGAGDSVAVAYDLGVGWPEMGPPCVTGWYALRAVVHACVDVELPTVLYAGGQGYPREDAGWVGAIRAAVPGRAELESGVGGGTPDPACMDAAGRAVAPGGATCLPLRDARLVLGSTELWPTCEVVGVASNEVMVWVEAEATEGR